MAEDTSHRTLALDALRRAITEAVDRYRAMHPDDMLRSAIALIDDDPTLEPGRRQIGTLLLTLAEQGSIEAVALMVALNMPEKKIFTAMKAVCSRSPDVKEGLVFTGIVAIFEEYAEGEVAAGRMVKTICPATGVALYGSVPKGSESDGKGSK